MKKIILALVIITSALGLFFYKNFTKPKPVVCSAPWSSLYCYNEDLKKLPKGPIYFIWASNGKELSQEPPPYLCTLHGVSIKNAFQTPDLPDSETIYYFCKENYETIIKGSAPPTAKYPSETKIPLTLTDELVQTLDETKPFRYIDPGDITEIYIEPIESESYRLSGWKMPPRP